MLFAARGLQGAFAALLAPSALALITVTFVEPHERAKAFGVYGAIAGGGAAWDSSWVLAHRVLRGAGACSSTSPSRSSR